MTRLKQVYARNVANLTPLIGDAAARLTVQANNWQAVGALVGLLVFLPLVIWAQLGAPALKWALVAAVGALVVFGLARGALLSYRSGPAASAFVSARLGCTVRLSGGGWRREVWARRIERARQTDERLHNGGV